MTSDSNEASKGARVKRRKPINHGQRRVNRKQKNYVCTISTRFLVRSCSGRHTKTKLKKRSIGELVKPLSEEKKAEGKDKWIEDQGEEACDEPIKEETSNSLSGCPSDSSDDNGQIAVEPPWINVLCGGEDDEDWNRTSACHGIISVMGRQRTMEDAVTVAPGLIKIGDHEIYDFYAVYDGHGDARVVNACRERMHQLLVEELEKSEPSSSNGGQGLRYWEKVMGSCFGKMDEEVNGDGCEGEVELGKAGWTVRTVGSAAMVVLVRKREVVVAHCGNCRAVLCRDGMAVPLSRDHKPDRPDEWQRIEAAGGQIIDWEGSDVLGIPISRSIGDLSLKPLVISDPEVTVTELTEMDESLVIATDGLWDVVSNETTCEIVKRYFNGQTNRTYGGVPGNCATDAAVLLAELAMARGSNDNISVIVVDLKKSQQ
ncbi:hypothetical protein K2173_010390 [Erythroxylum novogranatense]|uniref:protein-serine/threonine phosphatase n=1 Tax=Erythroxylum novogranatense TaxID=1862640 RepID=A0AAV8TFW6_9ROSI|nr:hypothetical protein K2173_010390 [Erythroxylum novogranatense]